MQIKDIIPNQPVSGFFMIMDNQLRNAKNGTNYLAMKIGDATGEVAVKIWNAPEELFQQLAPGEVIELLQLVPKLFKDQIQLDWDARNMTAFRLVPEEETDYRDFLPHAPGELAGYWEELERFITSVQETGLKKVLQFFFADQDFVAHFIRVPAALKRHHAYIGGLVEHTVGVTRLCEAAAGFYPAANRDLLITGAILHDIGKTRTYQIGKGFTGTDEGKLIGHLILGVQMVEQAVNQLGAEVNPEYQVRLRNNLLHLLVSHHGLMEWGSPIEPLTVEACILHHADNMDADVVKFLTIMRGQDATTDWAPYDNGLGRSIYLKNQFQVASSGKPSEAV
jgi:3'-5' exoribonuclease